MILEMSAALISSKLTALKRCSVPLTVEPRWNVVRLNQKLVQSSHSNQDSNRQINVALCDLADGYVKKLQAPFYSQQEPADHFLRKEQDD